MGPLKTIFLAGGPEIPENHHNCQLVHDKLKLDELKAMVENLRYTGDLKIMNIDIGIGPCSSKFPCGFCHAEKVGKDMVCNEDTELRSTENIEENNVKWKEAERKNKLKSKADPTAKKFFSCVHVPIIKEGLILELFPPPTLHNTLGVVNKTLEFLHMEWEAISEDECGVENFLASLHIRKKTYFGNTLEGGECEQVLSNLSKLREKVPAELHIFVDFLQAFKSVKDSCFGYTLYPDWDNDLKRFTAIFKQMRRQFASVSETVKIHIVSVHVRQFLLRDGCKRGLAEFSEQEGESAHQHWDKIWQRLKVNDEFSEAYKRAYIKTAALFTMQHS